MRVFYSMEVGMYIAKIATAAAIIKKKTGRLALSLSYLCLGI